MFNFYVYSATMPPRKRKSASRVSQSRSRFVLETMLGSTTADEHHDAKEKLLAAVKEEEDFVRTIHAAEQESLGFETHGVMFQNCPTPGRL